MSVDVTEGMCVVGVYHSLHSGFLALCESMLSPGVQLGHPC